MYPEYEPKGAPNAADELLRLNASISSLDKIVSENKLKIGEYYWQEINSDGIYPPELKEACDAIVAALAESAALSREIEAITERERQAKIIQLPPELDFTEIIQPEYKLPENVWSEAKRMESSNPETKQPEFRLPDNVWSGAVTPEVKKPDNIWPEYKPPQTPIKQPEAKLPDTAWPEYKLPQNARPEIKPPAYHAPGGQSAGNICFVCNTANLANARFCKGCGKKLEQPAPPVLPRTPAPYVQPVPPRAAPAQPYGNPCRMCSTLNAPGTKFCKNCGSKLAAPEAVPARPASPARCGYCGRELAPGVKFCGGCGAKL